jgi:hypothetical protein
MNRTGAGPESDAAIEAANRKQAEYYRRLLVEHREEIDHAIIEYVDALGKGGKIDVASARELRQIIRKAERERQAVDRMITVIDERFPIMHRPGLPDQSPGDGRPLVPMSPRRRPNIAVDRSHDQRVS